MIYLLIYIELTLNRDLILLGKRAIIETVNDGWRILHRLNIQDTRGIMNGKDFLYAGNLFHNLIIRYMRDYDCATIGLGCISLLPTIFFNVSIGRYMDEFGMESLRSKLGL